MVIHERVQAESQRKIILDLVVMMDIFNSTIGRRYLTRRTEVAQVLLTVSTSRLAECEKLFPPAGEFVEYFAG